MWWRSLIVPIQKEMHLLSSSERRADSASNFRTLSWALGNHDWHRHHFQPVTRPNNGLDGSKTLCRWSTVLIKGVNVRLGNVRNLQNVIITISKDLRPQSFTEEDTHAACRGARSREGCSRLSLRRRLRVSVRLFKAKLCVLKWKETCHQCNGVLPYFVFCCMMRI